MAGAYGPERSLASGSGYGADPARGSGLIGLHDRVGAIGGTVVNQSPAGAGTTVLVFLPLD